MPVVSDASTSSQLEYASKSFMHNSLNCHTGGSHLEQTTSGVKLTSDQGNGLSQKRSRDPTGEIRTVHNSLKILLHGH